MQASSSQRMDAEHAYLFRHGLVRDAAYALHLPGERAILHRLVLRLIEQLAAPDLDPLAGELALHARLGGEFAAELEYTWRAAEYTRSRYEFDAALRWFDAAAAIEPQPLLRVKALQKSANLLLLTGSAQAGHSRLAEALQLAREAGDVVWEASVLVSLAGIEQLSGRVAAAEALLQQALPLARKGGDQKTEGMALGNLAGVLRSAQRYDEAFEIQRRAIEIHRQSGDRHGEGISLGNLAVHLSDRGQLDEALACCREALAVNRDTGNRRTEGIVLGTIGSLLGKLGRLQEAADSYRQALPIHREVSNRPYEAWHMCELALVMLRLGEVGAARNSWRKGHELMLVYGDGPDLGIAMPDMRAVCARAGVAPFDSPD